MANRTRDIPIQFFVTAEEKKMIRKKMILSRTANMGAYLRKMAIDGIIVNTDTTYLEKQFYEMHKIWFLPTVVHRKLPIWNLL